MDPTTPAPSMLSRSFTKILRFQRASTIYSQGGAESSKDGKTHELKFSKSLGGCSSAPFEPPYSNGREERQQKKLSNDRETMKSLLANLFLRISAVKAAYAQLQFAQSPYDPESIQTADQAVVSELKHLSVLKQYSYTNSQFDIHSLVDSKSLLEAQIQEQRNLLKTYKITTRKLESDLECKSSEILSLQAQLLELDNQNNSMKARLRPGRRSLAASIDDPHLSGLNPGHFLTSLRYAVKSIRSFAKLMVCEMEAAGWDLDAAARAVHPDAVLRKPEHRILAFESYVCQKIFSDFHQRNFGLSSLEDRANWNQQQFFDEFIKLKSSNTKQVLDGKVAASSGLWKFCRAKYLSLVHRTMEVALFGGLKYGSLVSSGRGFPDSDFFFLGLAEMARRVWLLHCLFFSFGMEMDASIFQVRSGCRLSEVCMENAVEPVVVGGAGMRPTVGFTVVPGFKVGRMVVRSEVYV